jgi:sugar lactone lactonase YvrE
MTKNSRSGIGSGFIGIGSYLALLAGCGSGAPAASTPAIAPKAVLSASAATVSAGSPLTLTWSSSNATACTASGSWAGSLLPSGSSVLVPAAAGLSTYLLSCNGAGGSATVSAVVTVLDLPLLKAIGSGVADQQGHMVITTNAPAPGQSLTLDVASGSAPMAGALISIYATGADANAVIYAIAAGGNSGQGINFASKMMAILGTRASLATNAIINPRSTVAAVWSMARFMDVSGNLSGPGIGLSNAAATAASLVNPVDATPTPLLTADGNSPATLNTLADLLDACIDTTGSSSNACTQLFTQAQQPGDAPLVDTLAAARSIARNPAAHVAALFSIAGTDVSDLPNLSAAPPDWTLSVSLAGGGLSAPSAVAFDTAGNAWVADYYDAVSEFSPAGVALSPSTGITGGGIHESYSISVDAQQNVWISNQESAASINAGHGSLTKLDSTGAILSGAGFAGGGIDFPYALAIDSVGNVWTANYGNSTISKLDGSGNALSPDAGVTGGGLSFPVALSIDATDNIWVANNGSRNLSAFTSSGADLSSGSGFSGGGVDASQGVAIDQGGTVWSTNYYDASVSATDRNGNPLSPPMGYTGGGLSFPSGIAIDGNGRVWVANFRGNSVTQLQGSLDTAPGAPLSPSAGFLSSSLDGPLQLAIDGAGNVWVANYFGNSLTKFIGIAEPVITPIIGPPRSGRGSSTTSPAQ